MTRRPIFWLAFTALGLAGVVTAVTLFSTALPSISVEIDMDRSAAMDSAAALAARYGWGAPDDRSAATFGLADDLVQTYVELEGGGREVVERLAERNVYEAYQWRVRRFAEGRVEELWTRFTPAGEPYGFRLTLAEDDPGSANLTAAEARDLAETTASDWGVALESYRLLDASSETLPAGRTDHTFVFERADEQIGEARFRLRVVVSGSRPSELTHLVSVPEAFSRRYGDMRSTNDAIALVAQAVLLLLFVLLGAGVGSALLLKERWLEWRMPLAWGAAIAALFGAGTINQLPLSWTSYDTALSATSFALQQIAGGAAIAVLGTPLIAFFLLAGESLGRKAFPDHVQQWRFWSPEVASSSTALGMTFAAYLLVGLQVGYVVLFYLATGRLEGWWSPADALVQPDLLATYQPWLEAVSLAFLASFWEESLFRAVPIACAALLGVRYGRKGLWIWGAVAVQAIVFAAGHANYPQQPPYARVIELTAPALLWGAVYVFYGLVPTIMAHFLYDLSLISLVLFESEAWFDQGVIVAVGLVPVAIVVAARVRHGARSRPPEWAYNGAWTPRAPAEAASEAPRAAPVDVAGTVSGPRAAEARGLPSRAVWAAVGVGVACVAAAVVVRRPPPPLWGDRDEAITAATTALEAREVRVGEWDVLVTISTGATEGRTYVFQEAGPEAFAELEGEYFGAPRWLVRLVDWEADPSERVEELRVWVGPGGAATRVSHTLPEGRPGASLEVDAARDLALGAVSESYGLEAADLREVAAEETSRPNRTDWLFTFTEIDRLVDAQGEARIQVRVAGDEVVDVAPTIHVPEEWERERRRLDSRTRILAGGLGLLALIGFGGAAVTAVVVWSRGGLEASVMWKLTGVSFSALVLSSANNWPATAAAFVTNQPRDFQVGATVVGLALVACVVAPAVGLVGALGHAWLGRVRQERVPLLAGPALGLALGGLLLLGSGLVPRPATGSYFGAVTIVPPLAAALDGVSAFLLLTAAILVVVGLRERFGHHVVVSSTLWFLVVAASVVLVPVELQTSALSWGLGALAVGACLGVGVYAGSRWPILVPGAVATMLALFSLGSAWSGPYAGARVGGAVAALLLGALAWAWTRELAGGPGRRDQSPDETRASVGRE